MQRFNVMGTGTIYYLHFIQTKQQNVFISMRILHHHDKRQWHRFYFSIVFNIVINCYFEKSFQS